MTRIEHFTGVQMEYTSILESSGTEVLKTLYNLLGNMLESKGMNLDNSIFTNGMSTSESGVFDMQYKINRKITLDGKNYNIRATTEQDYADKIMCLRGQTHSVSPQVKHVFGTYAKEWYDTYSAPNIEKNTEAQYTWCLEKHILPFFGDMNIEDVTTTDVQKFFNQLDLKKTSRHPLHVVLKMIFDSALEDDLIAKNPAKSHRLKIGGEDGNKTATYTVEEMRYLANHINDCSNQIDKCYLSLQMFHGMRLEEVLGLRWEDIDFINREIHIVRAVTHPDRNQPEIKETKTRSSVRTVGLSSNTYDLLSSVKDEDRTGFVLGGEQPLSYQKVKRMCERIEKETGFDGHITPIRFRTTHLTDLYDQTHDITLTQHTAGHASSTTTLKYYVKGRQDVIQAQKVIDSLYLN